jgi:hypothetical protein
VADARVPVRAGRARRYARRRGQAGPGAGFRRADWAPVAPDTINNDFVMPAEMVLRGWWPA